MGDNVLAPSAFEPGPHWSWGGLSQGLSRTMVLGSGYFYPTQDSFTKQTCLRAHCLVGREDVESALSQSNGPPSNPDASLFLSKPLPPLTLSQHWLPTGSDRLISCFYPPIHKEFSCDPPPPLQELPLEKGGKKEGGRREEGGGRRSTVG